MYLLSKYFISFLNNQHEHQQSAALFFLCVSLSSVWIYLWTHQGNVISALICPTNWRNQLQHCSITGGLAVPAPVLVTSTNVLSNRDSGVKQSTFGDEYYTFTLALTCVFCFTSVHLLKHKHTELNRVPENIWVTRQSQCTYIAQVWYGKRCKLTAKSWYWSLCFFLLKHSLIFCSLMNCKLFSRLN